MKMMMEAIKAMADVAEMPEEQSVVPSHGSEKPQAANKKALDFRLRTIGRPRVYPSIASALND